MLRGRLARNQWLLADQALVSAMNFLTTALLARMLGVHRFGIFSVFYIILQYLNSIQLALIASTMMSIGPQLRDGAEHRAFLRGMAGYQYFFSLACGAATALFAVLEYFHLVPWNLDTSVFLPFILTIIGFQTQDWFRRFCYVQERGFTLFSNDIISYTGQVAALVILWWSHRMSVNAAYYAIAATSFAAFAVGFFREDISATWNETKIAFRRSWVMGRSLLVASQAQWLGSQGIFLIVAAIAGVGAASGIRAVITLMGPVNVLYQLLDNVIPVRAAAAYSKGGEHSLVVYLRRVCVILAGPVGVLVLIASIFARPIMTLAFGHAYAEFAPLVVWQGVYLWLGLIYRILIYYLRTVEHAAALARVATAVAAVSTTACFLLTRRYGATGGMEALFAGQVLNVTLILVPVLRIHRKAVAADGDVSIA